MYNSICQSQRSRIYYKLRKAFSNMIATEFKINFEINLLCLEKTD